MFQKRPHKPLIIRVVMLQIHIHILMKSQKQSSYQ